MNYLSLFISLSLGAACAEKVLSVNNVTSESYKNVNSSSSELWKKQIIDQLQDTIKTQNKVIHDLITMLEHYNESLAELNHTVASQNEEIIYLKEILSNSYGIRRTSNSLEKYDASRDIIDSTLLKGKGLISDDCRNSGIAFYAYLSSLINVPERSHVLQFDVVKTNVGDAYNPKNGTFVAPREGLYTFSWTVGLTWKSTVCTCLRINGKVFGMTFGSTPFDKFGAQMTTGNVVACLEKNDVVTVETCDNINTIGMILSDIYRMTSFAGWRIGRCQ